jgi:hypothetical protein
MVLTKASSFGHSCKVAIAVESEWMKLLFVPANEMP